jgi:hypothetical protein
MKIFATALVGLSALACAFAQSPGPMVGTWKGISNSAVFGSGLHHPSVKTEESEVRFRHVEYTLTIDKQEGRNFVGSIGSDTHKEIVLGALAKDLKSGVMVNEHGTFNFTLPDTRTLELCFTQVVPGSPSIPKVASCFEMEKR